MAATSKLVLNMDAMQEDFFADTALIGIGCASPLYRFCWMINRQFNIDFVREPEIDIKLPDKKTGSFHYFPIYQYLVPAGGHTHILYSLKNGEKSLLPEVKQLDFLWMVQSLHPEKDTSEYVTLLRGMPEVQMARILLPDQLKSLNNLLV